MQYIENKNKITLFGGFSFLHTHTHTNIQQRKENCLSNRTLLIAGEFEEKV